jgi:predicted enzyme related to lactoylglutathione lyase
MSPPPSTFIWYELLTTDVAGAASFYAAVAGWAAQDSGAPGMDYRILSIDGSGVGGLMAIPPAAASAGMPPQWLGYLGVADVDASLAAIVADGGSVQMPAMDIPGVGRIAMAADPQGAPFYVMTPLGTGVSTVFLPGQPGHRGWNELRSSDWEAAFAFYTKQFGWGRSAALDMGPIGTYLLFNAGGEEAIGGMMTLPDLPRPFWLSYINVDEIVAAKRRVEAAGGTVLAGPHEVPGGLWVVQARDPQGAMFALVGPKQG